MYSIEDLFDKRSVVGIKLEQLIADKGYTKMELTKNVGVSRPTLDKVLTGTLTNKTNYEKYVTKVMDYLGISADMLLGNIKNEYIRTREIRSLMKINAKEVAKATGIPLTRLVEIEAGEKASLAELRDIALCLSVSVRCLLGESFFEPQIATLDFCIKKKDDVHSECYSGFWGHIGIQCRNKEEFLWYPITGNTRKSIYKMLNNNRLVVPCMNNKVLFINMQNINEIVLSDFDCDVPGFINWSSEVDCGAVPLVVYEALEDYWCEDDENEELLSSGLRQIVKNFLEKNELDEDLAGKELKLSQIYYTDGYIRTVSIDFDQPENISDEIYIMYVFEDSEFADDFLFCQDTAGTEIFLNMKNISMLELPLLKVEEAICEQMDEMYEDISE